MAISINVGTMPLRGRRRFAHVIRLVVAYYLPLPQVAVKSLRFRLTSESVKVTIRVVTKNMV